MSEKYKKLMNEFNGRGLLSLYGKRVMFRSNGQGGISYWDITESDDGRFHAKCDGFGIDVEFSTYEFDDDNRVLKTDSGVFMMPKSQRLTDHHNTFYVEEFALKMGDALRQLSNERGDWYLNGSDKNMFADSMARNIEHIKSGNSEDEIQKACIDTANYAMMCYYLIGKGETSDCSTVQ